MRYYLIGLPGSGKSYWGKIWANSAELPFIDLDIYIEDKEQITISEIFSIKGETYFREVESEYLKVLSSKYNDIIIACGGGTPYYNDNMTYINEKGISIFINTNTELITKHLLELEEIGKRPLFKSLKTESEVKNHLDNLLKERIVYYKKARHEIIPGNYNQTINKFLEIFKS